MKFSKILFFSLGLFFAGFWYLWPSNISKIVTITSFNAAPELVSPPMKDSATLLYIFDVDETLITYKDLLLREDNRESSEGKKLQSYFNENCKKPNDAAYGQYIWSQIFLQAHKILIEPEVKNIIARLQKQGVFVIGLTRLLTGKFGSIPRLEDWRYAQLVSFDIDFSKTSPLSNFVFKELESKEAKHPILFKGILLTDHYSKKETLQRFLKEFKLVKGYLPKKIIYMDDTLSYLEEVQDLCKSLGIGFIGYHYLGSKSLPGKFNLELAKEQINHLLTQEAWISDAQAGEILERTK